MRHIILAAALAAAVAAPVDAAVLFTLEASATPRSGSVAPDRPIRVLAGTRPPPISATFP